MNAVTASMAENGRQQLSESFYAEYHPKILRYVRKSIQNKADAEDLTQQVFLKALERFDTFDEQRNAAAWVYAIARNAVIDFFRTRHVHVDLDELPEPTAEDESPLETVISREGQAALARALKTLAQGERDIIILRYYNGRSLAAIAEDMNLPYGRIKRMHAKALAQLELQLRFMK